MSERGDVMGDIEHSEDYYHGFQQGVRSVDHDYVRNSRDLIERVAASEAEERELRQQLKGAVEAIKQAEVRLIHGGCNVPGYVGGITVFFPGDSWRDLRDALGGR